MENCEECGNTLKVSRKREECLDICDKCYEALTERVKFLSDRDNRMDLVRAATFFASNSNNEATRLRCFFASVMPELPQNKVEKFIQLQTQK